MRIVHWKMREVQKGETMSKLAAKLVHLCLFGAISEWKNQLLRLMDESRTK